MFRFRSALQNLTRGLRTVVQPTVSSIKQPNVLPSPLIPRVPSAGNSTKMLLGALAVGTASGIAYVSYEQKKRNIKALSEIRISNLDELNQLEQEMVKLASSSAKEEKTEVQHSVETWCKTINKAVTKGDTSIFIEYLNKLATVFGVVTDEYLAALINTCANQGRVSLLRVLEDKFELGDLIAQNKLATKLMQHSAADEIERLSNQFVQGVGHVKEEGTRLKLKQFESEDKSRTEGSVPTPLVTGLDVIDDTMLMLSYLESQESARTEVSGKYQNIVALELQEHEGKEGFVNYLQTLKAIAEKENRPIDSIFILHGSHFTCGQIRVEKKSDNSGKYDVKLLYMDSLGSGIGTYAGYDLVPNFEQVFPGQTKYITSEVKEQYAGKGCSVFSLMHVYDLIHLPETFAAHVQQGGKGYRDIFDYMDQDTTETHEGVYTDREGNICKMVYDTALPPLAFSRAKQSMSKSGVENYTEPSGKTYPKTIVGYMGYPHEVAHSPASRQKEADLVINAHIPVSVRDFVAANVRTDAQGKGQNLTTQLLIGHWGLNLTSWLAEQTPEQIKQHASAFGVEELARKHGVTPTIEELPVGPSDKDRPGL